MEGNMFEKKDVIYSESMGVCRVADIVRLSPNNRLGEPVPYYLLKSVFDSSKVAYIPVKHHQVALRELISKEEASAVSEEELKKLDELRQAEIRYVLEQEP